MNKSILFILIAAGLSVVGCGSNDSKLSETEKQEMKKLFKEGIQPGQMPANAPKTPSASSNPNANAPAMNQPTDGGGTGQL